MSEAPGVLYHAQAQDARRGGVVLSSAGRMIDPPLRRFCDGLAEQGYEVAAIGDAEPEPAARRLAGPVFLLSLGAPGAMAWSAICAEGQAFAAASLYEPPVAVLTGGEPRCPTALHLTVARAGWPIHLEQLCDRRQDIRAFPYPDAGELTADHGDAAHLARLRTLQLFHRAAGAKGEMGG